MTLYITTNNEAYCNTIVQISLLVNMLINQHWLISYVKLLMLVSFE